MGHSCRKGLLALPSLPSLQPLKTSTHDADLGAEEPLGLTRALTPDCFQISFSFCHWLGHGRTTAMSVHHPGIPLIRSGFRRVVQMRVLSWKAGMVARGPETGHEAELYLWTISDGLRAPGKVSQQERLTMMSHTEALHKLRLLFNWLNMSHWSPAKQVKSLLFTVAFK